ncbi:BTAD domain-containing putative transcriptional regulator [Saccharothrix violaceirubra]|uniref:DNA-binding SARP family transcriptional activator n=1 Tax=Saccharothrix violaceirubra TaxID=413306 RepID=A0A7W7WUY4_9PSEU|nr:BTAD domain-containing putative transcriptional regulator [Saccharothrix violaceirubra]MBB4964561.1 DNA-binding SARP family transcriptional activator [Saccharothrix violaceirubra]
MLRRDGAEARDLAHDEFGVLGPLVVRRGGRVVTITAAKHRVVLATLLLCANRSVSAAELIRRVWGGVPPDRAGQTLPVYVMRLRRVLGDPAVIHTTSTGYRIDVPDGALDLDRFGVSADAGRAAVAGGDAAGAVVHYEQALALWRGPVLADVPSESLHETEVPALAERRLRVLSELMDVKLRLDRCDEVIADLRRLTARHPLRERFWSQLMVALYRVDRQADALDAYRQASTALARELGVDPSEALRSVHHAILTGDPALHRPAATEWTPVSQLPAPVGNFVGREEELERVTGLLSGSTATVVVCGSPGVGKTAFAISVGHAVRDRYPDGQLYVNLRGHSTSPPLTTSAVLARFLRAMGVRADRIPVGEDALVRGYRNRLRGRRVLIMLDNAASTDQVLPLLPGEAGCSVLVTSRNELCSGTCQTVVRLDVLRGDEAWRLLARSLGPNVAMSEFEAIGELARLCGYLPLALRIALGNLVGSSHADISSYVDELRGGDRLAALAVDNDDSAAVRRAFDLSYAALSPDAARLFRLAGLVPGPDFSVAGAAALIGGPESTTRRLLGDLAAAHLVQRVGADRFAMHDLLQDYAADRSRAAGDDGTAARRRLFDWYLGTAVAVGDVLYPELRPGPAGTPTLGAARARAWLEAERPSVLAATEYCARFGPRRLAWQLIDAVSGYFGSHGHHVEFLHAVDAALGAARRDREPAAQTAMLVWLAAEHRNLGNLRVAQRYLREAEPTGDTLWLHAGLDGVVNLELGDFAAATTSFTRMLDLGAHARIGGLAGLGAVALMRGDVTRAEESLLDGLERARVAEGVNLEATCASLLARCRLETGAYESAVELLRFALAAWYRTGARHARAEGLAYLATALCLDGAHAEALRTAQRGLALVQELGGSPRIESEVHNALGLVLRHQGEPGRAAAAHRRALELATDCDYRYGVTRTHVLIAKALRDDGLVGDAVRHARIGRDLAFRSGFGTFGRTADDLLSALSPS